MHHFRIIFFTAIALFCTVATSRAANKDYADPQGSFSLQIPENWKVQRQPLDAGSWMTEFSDGGAKKDGELTVLVFPLPNEIGEATPEVLDGVGQLFIGTVLALLKDTGEVEASPIVPAKLGARNVMRSDVTYRPKEGAAEQGYILAMLGRKNVVLVTVSAAPNDKATLQKVESLLPTLALEASQPAVAGLPGTTPSPDGGAGNRAADTIPGSMDDMAEAVAVGGELLTIQQEIAGSAGATQTPTATNPPGKLDEATVRASFARQDAARLAAQPNTKARADAARSAAAAAASVAWIVFDAGKHEEAATWFARRAELKKESYDNLRAYLESKLATTEARIKVLRGALTEKNDATREQQLRMTLDSWVSVQTSVLSLLHTLARENNDTSTRLKYTEQELALRRAILAEAVQAGAADEQIHTKKAQVANALSLVGSARVDLALFDEAARDYNEALEIRRSLPVDFPKRALYSALQDLGFLSSRNGEFRRAREQYEQALAALEESTALRQQTIEAETEPLVKALAITNDVTQQVSLLSNLATVEVDAGNYKTALAYHDRALKLLETIPQEGFPGVFRNKFRATTLSNIAVAHAESGEIDQALQELETVLQLKRAGGDDEDAAVVLQNIALLHYEKGDLEQARRYIQQARQIFIASQELRGVVGTTIALAMLATRAEQIPEAQRHAEEALPLARKIGDLSWIGHATRVLALVRLNQNQLVAATQLLQEAEATDKRVGSPLATTYTLELQGRVLEAGNNQTAALEKYRQGITLLEGVRATAASETAFSNLRSSYGIYERMVRLLIKMGHTDEAFDYLNRAKSKRMQDSMRLSSLKTGDVALQALLDRANGLETKLRTVEAELQGEQSRPAAERDDTKIQNLKLVAASTQGEYRRVIEQINAANPNNAKNFTVNPKALKETQRSIPEGVIFVQYAPLGEQLYIFLVTRDTLKIYTPPVQPEALWKRIKAVRRQIAAREDPNGRGFKGSRMNDVLTREGKAPGSTSGDATRGATMAAAPEGEDAAPLNDNLTALYAMLIAPIESEIADKHTIAFIPNQLLYYLPMQALAKKQGDKLRYLIEDKRLVYLTAADVMRVVQPRDEAKLTGGLVAFGNPSGAELPFAEAEVKAIAQIFPAAQAFAGAQVTKDSVKAEGNLNKRIVHFATHGVLNPGQPDQSYIQLTQSNTPDAAQLTVGEVWDLPLNKVDLVTLSACQTALAGSDPDGGEITTLAEAFSSAGATTVVASLWSVADESTKELMVEFYTQLAAGKPKAEAIQAAQLKVLKNPKYTHPYYWAPFILMGDWR